MAIRKDLSRFLLGFLGLGGEEEARQNLTRRRGIKKTPHKGRKKKSALSDLL